MKVEVDARGLEMPKTGYSNKKSIGKIEGRKHSDCGGQ